jgi:hypothetical protein
MMMFIGTETLVTQSHTLMSQGLSAHLAETTSPIPSLKGLHTAYCKPQQLQRQRITSVADEATRGARTDREVLGRREEGLGGWEGKRNECLHAHTRTHTH